MEGERRRQKRRGVRISDRYCPTFPTKDLLSNMQIIAEQEPPRGTVFTTDKVVIGNAATFGFVLAGNEAASKQISGEAAACRVKSVAIFPANQRISSGFHKLCKPDLLTSRSVLLP